MNLDPLFSGCPEGALFDVLIIGAGPAGALAAREAARLGASVALVDKAKFPRHKTCGCCLSRAAVTQLEDAGLGDLLPSLAARPLRAIQLTAAGRTAHLPWPGGVAVSRAALDHALTSAAVTAGAVFVDDTAAALGDLQPGWRDVLLRRNDTSHRLRARVVIVADGLSGHVLDDVTGAQPVVHHRSRIGVSAVLPRTAADVPACTIAMACGRGGYVGMVSLEDGTIDVAAALDPGFMRACGGAAGAVSGLLAASGVAVPAGLVDVRWKGTPQLTRRRPILGAERLLVVGDAAGYVEPFTGEGIAWALAGGRAVAPIAVDAARPAHWDSNTVQLWQQRHAALLRGRQRRCRWVARLLRSPRLTAALVALLCKLPGAARPLIDRFHQPIEVTS